MIPYVKPYKPVTNEFDIPHEKEVLCTSKQKNVPDQKSLRDELLGRFEREKHGLKNREISVMTRMSVDIVEIIDALVELEIFKSRSEAVAAFVERMVVAKMNLFEEIRIQAKDIASKREAAKHLAFQAIQSDKK
jgi:Arc/MetJ-type ribon-helix-helix transcriptional regulator